VHDDVPTREEFEDHKRFMNKVVFGDEVMEGIVPTQREHRRVLFGDKERGEIGLLKRMDIVERKDIYRMGWVAGAAAIGGVVGGFIVKFIL